MTMVRGIRGATRAGENTKEEIMSATEELLLRMVEANDVAREDIASIFLTTTPDLNAEFPAYVTRRMSWNSVPVLCAREIDVPHGMAAVIRVMMHVNTELTQTEIKHVYLGGTAVLRPDLAEEKKQ